MKLGTQVMILALAVVLLLNSDNSFAAESKERVVLEPILVTAQKREENSQDVPISMNIFSDTQLEDAGIKNTRDLTRFTPNAYMRYGTAGNIIVFRGISAFHTSLYGPAGFYVDDVCYPLHYMHNPDLFNVERIEVLKGPQGTLYGRNSESGVVNVVTRQPGNEFFGKIFGEYGSYDAPHDDVASWRYGGDISGPVAKDKLYLGLAVLGEDSDGFMVNGYQDDEEACKTDHKSARATLRWTPSDRWDLSLTGDTAKTDDGMNYYRYFTGPFKTERHTNAYDGKNISEEEHGGGNLRINYKGDSFNILSVTGLREYDRDLAVDFDSSSAPLGNNIFDFQNNTVSEEVRLSSLEGSGPFQWLTGIYGFNEETDVDFEMERLNPAMASTRFTKTESRNYAVFGQGTYTCWDRLHLTLGLRYEHLRLEGEQEFISAGGSKSYDKDLDYNELLPKASLACDINDNIMSYFSVAQGYLAGGYSYGFATDVSNFTYDPEYTWNYEVGLKSSWFDEKLLFNLALFYIDIEDKQVTEHIPGMMGAMQVTNAAEAHSQGVELEIKARPVQGLDLFAGLGYTEAKVDEWVAWENGLEYDYEGEHLPNAPEYTYNLGAQYRMGNGLFIRGDLLGTGDFYFDTKNKLKEEGYQLVNLRMGYEGEHIGVTFWGENLFDKEYETMKIDWGGEELGQDGSPRKLGVKVTWWF